jgi:hypothetical protein
MVQNAPSRAEEGHLDVHVAKFERPDTYVIGKDGRKRRM